jgi:hypothetical protein
MGRGLGLGLGRGGGRGLGFGFRGQSPEWPYIGRGRGGQPRCACYTRGAGRDFNRTYSQAGTTSRQDEIVRLKDQAEALRQQLSGIEARLRQVEDVKD